MSDNTLFSGIEHVTIAARDPKALAKWYCDKLGFTVAYESSRSLTTYVRLGESLIEIIEAGHAERILHGDRDPGYRHVGISVSDIHKANENRQGQRRRIKGRAEREGWRLDPVLRGS